MQEFAGKVAVVTGAGSGIGQALAVELARAGAKVAISDVNSEGLERTAQRHAVVLQLPQQVVCRSTGVV